MKRRNFLGMVLGAVVGPSLGENAARSGKIKWVSYRDQSPYQTGHYDPCTYSYPGEVQSEQERYDGEPGGQG